MTGIVIWQAFSRFSASLIVDTSRFANRVLATVRTGTGWYFNLVTGRQGYGENALGGPIASPRVMCWTASAAVHSPERSRCIARSTMNGRPLSTVGRHSVWSSWTDPYGITQIYISWPTVAKRAREHPSHGVARAIISTDGRQYCMYRLHDGGGRPRNPVRPCGNTTLAANTPPTEQGAS